MKPTPHIQFEIENGLPVAADAEREDIPSPVMLDDALHLVRDWYGRHGFGLLRRRGGLLFRLFAFVRLLRTVYIHWRSAR